MIADTTGRRFRLSSERGQLRLSIKSKVFLLVGASLTISLLSYVLAGNSLVIKDKTSYIYDSTLAEARSVANAANAQLERASATLRLFAGFIPPRGSSMATSRFGSLEKAFEENGRSAGLSSMLVLSMPDTSRFKSEFALGSHSGALDQAVGQHAWTPEIFQSAEMVVGSHSEHGIPVGVRAIDPSGEPVALVGLMIPHKDLLQDTSKRAQVYLTDKHGRIVLSRPDPLKPLAQGHVQELVTQLSAKKFESGVQELKFDGREFLVAYLRFGKGTMYVLNFMPKDVAFSAGRALVNRTLMLGVSILLIALGLTLIFARATTGRLQQMWAATQRVTQGDFSVRVEISSTTRDEVSDLADSFNSMASKIDELMAATAQQARMEKELEMAQMIQTRYFPTRDLAHANMSVAGKLMPATECAGDWWHYKLIGDDLIIIVGDVTGHGVSSALVTAAGHAAFSLITKLSAEARNQAPSVPSLLKCINEAVLTAGAGEVTMTAFVASINLKSGRMQMANAAHNPPYLIGSRVKKGHAMSLLGDPILSLGTAPNLNVEVSEIFLEPGDSVLFYTDGLFDSRVSDGTKMPKLRFLEEVKEASNEIRSDAGKICATAMTRTIEFFGEKADNRQDDITMIVAKVPMNAKFSANPKGNKAA